MDEEMEIFDLTILGLLGPLKERGEIIGLLKRLCENENENKKVK